MVGKLNYSMVTRPKNCIWSECDTLISFGIENESLECSNMNNHILEKGSGKGLLYSICGHTQVSDFLDTDWTSSYIHRW